MEQNNFKLAPDIFQRSVLYCGEPVMTFPPRRTGC